MPGQQRIGFILTQISNVLTVVAASLLIVYIGDEYLGHPLQRWINRAASPASQAKGKALPASLAGSIRQNSIIFGLSTRCGYCKKEIPMYRQLVAQLRNRGVGLYAAFPESAADAKAFLSESQLDELLVQDGWFQRLGIHATPTIVLVNASGIVTDVVQGAGRKSAHDIVRMLDSSN